MEELHTTRSAAEFLGVSEASIRRWSDAGRLPVQRIGRRRERRFREADLERFHRHDADASASRAAVTSVTAGATGFAPHTHIPTFYESSAGRIRLSVPFFRDGLSGGEMCLLVAAGNVAAEYRRELRAEGIDVDAARRQEQLQVIPNLGGTVRSALDTVENFFWKASRNGSRVPRIVGEMASVRAGFKTDREMLDYEFAFNALTQRFPCVVLCQFDVREFAGPTLLGAFKAHPDLFGLPLTDVLL